MQLIRGLHNLKALFPNGCVATIGNYDGVHLGHQQILARLKAKSVELKIPAVVVIFEPQPEEFFSNEQVLRLTSLREKLQLFSQYDIDQILVLAFNHCFANIAATAFIEEIILNKLHTKYLIVGDDFSFGCNCKGNFALSGQYAHSSDLIVEKMPTFLLDGKRVSSSSIRTALLNGDVALAARLLDRPYRASGRVVHGNHLGRDLGFPTANIYLARRELPLAGVYAVKVYGVGKSHLYGVTNIGFCPTVFRVGKSFEVYIFNFSADIYGRRIMVEFVEKIREEQKFTSFAGLVAQIKLDLEKAKEILGMVGLLH